MEVNHKGWTLVVRAIVFYWTCCCAAATPSAECLGDVSECYAFIDISPNTWLDLVKPGPYSTLEKQLAFATEGDLCTLDKLYTLHPDYNMRVLAGATGELGFPGAEEQVQAVLSWCSLTQDMVARLVLVFETEGSCDKARMVREEWFVASGAIYENFPASRDLELDAYPGKFSDLISKGTRALSDSIESGLWKVCQSDNQEEKRFALSSLSLEVGVMLRRSMEQTRMYCGLKNLADELVFTGVIDGVNRLPSIRYHDDLYGRHWDVIEYLLIETPIRGSLVEVGSALGAIGLVTSKRFKGSVSYVGVEPKLRDCVRDKFDGLNNTRLIEKTSQEAAQEFGDSSIDLVFIDGPHTYQNVKNDITIWSKKLSPNGVLSGHDFTAQHPPLMWAVLEQCILSQKRSLHVGPDGVWWTYMQGAP